MERIEFITLPGYRRYWVEWSRPQREPVTGDKVQFLGERWNVVEVGWAVYEETGAHCAGCWIHLEADEKTP